MDTATEEGTIVKEDTASTIAEEDIAIKVGTTAGGILEEGTATRGTGLCLWL